MEANTYKQQQQQTFHYNQVGEQRYIVSRLKQRTI